MTPADIRVACELVLQRYPDATLEKNGVGNLSIIGGGVYVGWIDLRDGDVEWTTP